MALPNLTEIDQEPQRQPFQMRRVLIAALAIFVVLMSISAMFWAPTLYYVIKERNPDLSIPPQAAGLTLDTTERGQRTADGIADALSVPIGFEKIVSGAYQNPTSANQSAILMAGAVTLFRPADQLDKLFNVITDNAGGVTQKRSIDTGSLGGEVECGITMIDAAEVPVCAWADHGSAGLALLPGHTVDEAAKRFTALRADVQK